MWQANPFVSAEDEFVVIQMEWVDRQIDRQKGRERKEMDRYIQDIPL